MCLAGLEISNFTRRQSRRSHRQIVGVFMMMMNLSFDCCYRGGQTGLLVIHLRNFMLSIPGAQETPWFIVKGCTGRVSSPLRRRGERLQRKREELPFNVYTQRRHFGEPGRRRSTVCKPHLDRFGGKRYVQLYAPAPNNAPIYSDA